VYNPPYTSQYQPFVSGTNAVTPLPLANRTGYCKNVGNNNSINNNTYGPLPSFHQCFPKLLDSELKLLNEHKGCQKCRRLYVPHTKINCLNNWPNLSTYRTLTYNMAMAAMSSMAVALVTSTSYNADQQFYSGNKNGQLVNGSLPGSSVWPSAEGALPSNNHFYFGGFMAPSAVSFSMPSPSIQPSAFIEDPVGNTDDATSSSVVLPSASINAVLPSMSFNFVLLGDSPKSSEDVSPLIVPKLMWPANVWGHEEFQVVINFMLDNGSELVLIRPEIVSNLALLIQKLNNPISVTLALNDTKTVCTFSNFVSLQLSSINNACSSCPVCALIAPGLCHDILLGLLFLAHNNIVIDHASCTAIDKNCGFDLSNEPKSTSKPIFLKLSPKERRLYIKECHKLLLTELKWKCSARLSVLERNNSFKIVKPVDVLSLIAAFIETLACKEKLANLEKTLKSKFKDIFEPIPHIDSLPTYEAARIQLIDAYKKISTCKYEVPHQFCKSFAILIQKRLDSGFIRPSSSAHILPSFIIPKAYPKALPRWVCDYRQLNILQTIKHTTDN